MTTSIAPEARRSVGLFSAGSLIADHKPKLAWAKSPESGKDILTVSEMPVFRSGTFRDSMGYQHTWEDLHIEQMVANHDYLKAQGIFEDVPVRKGHGSFLGDPMDALIGWHTGLRAETRTSKHDGKEYTYLLASYEIFDEAAQKHIDGGHWRNRSSEVGFYLTNAEAEYWPVYQGFAYVDIPAVEGLNGFSKAVKNRNNFSMMIEEEVGGMDPDENEEQAETPASGEPNESTPANDAGENETPVQEVPETPVVQPASLVESQHSAPIATHSFRVNGQPVSDFSAVQAHIDSLETANVEREQTVRGDFVKGLASGNKIPATQVPALTAHAQGLTPEQYASWSASYESVPASGLFGQYGVSGGEEASSSTGFVSSEAGEVKRLEGVVAMHSRTMSPDQVKQTDSYKKLQHLLDAKS